MAASHIIRVPRTDEDGAFVLGEVTPSGSKPLNVKFVATEGEEPYVVKCEFWLSLSPSAERVLPWLPASHLLPMPASRVCLTH